MRSWAKPSLASSAPRSASTASRPAAVLWPDQGLSDALERETLACSAPGRTGAHRVARGIARTLLFLCRHAEDITGQIIALCHGRTSPQ